MQLFMTREGVDASTPFSNHVWLHDGLDIIAVSILLFTISSMPATKATLRAAAIVSLLPAVAIVYGLVATPYWSPLFLVPAAAAVAFAVWGWALSGSSSVE